MIVIIKKDESTSVPREVTDLAGARALAAQYPDMPVSIQHEDGSTTLLADMPDEEPAAETSTETTEDLPLEGEQPPVQA